MATSNTHNDGISATTGALSDMVNGFQTEDAMVLRPPKPEEVERNYAFNMADEHGTQGSYATMIHSLGGFFGALGSIPCCLICPNPYKNVDQGSVGLVSKFGQFRRAVGPGLVNVNPMTERLVHVDIRIQVIDVPEQICITKDNVTMSLNSVVYYQIFAPHKATFGISNVRQALIDRTQTTLRYVIGANTLQNAIEHREQLGQMIAEITSEVTAGWGVLVESMLIKDMYFSKGLQETLSMAAQSKRVGESRIITAKAEVESAKLMRKAADILSSAPAMQIRYLESMQAIAKSANSNTIFMPGAPQSSSVYTGTANASVVQKAD